MQADIVGTNITMSLCGIRAQTPEGENWIDEHIDTETAPTWAGYIVVESRFVDAIIEGIVSDGLSIDNAA